MRKTLEEKWNLEGMFDILGTEPSFVNPMSCLLSLNNSMLLYTNAKHCVVNT
jgi:hypothetical protein